MKCLKAAQGTKCVRCSRKSLQCDFLEHRRGRKKGFKFVTKDLSCMLVCWLIYKKTKQNSIEGCKFDFRQLPRRWR